MIDAVQAPLKPLIFNRLSFKLDRRFQRMSNGLWNSYSHLFKILPASSTPRGANGAHLGPWLAPCWAKPGPCQGYIGSMLATHGLFGAILGPCWVAGYKK